CPSSCSPFTSAAASRKCWPAAASPPRSAIEEAMAASPPFKLDDYKKRMDGALNALTHEFSGLRTGRASSSLLDPVQVEAYGSTSPLKGVASVPGPEARMTPVQVGDKAVAPAVEKATRAATLGLNPITDGQTLRVPIPPLTGERRVELT